ncbi:hypothetical protein HK101_007466 [Irineochytrium annulatum]|nr:hypothetical protein HK101_007466 [Irineochytrium annulatum]
MHRTFQYILPASQDYASPLVDLVPPPASAFSPLSATTSPGLVSPRTGSESGATDDRGGFAEEDPALREEMRRVSRQRVLVTILEVGGMEALSLARTAAVAAADAIMICFDVADRSSFDAVWGFWKMTAIAKKTLKFPCLLVGNQVDRIGTFASIIKVAYVETTAKAPRSVEHCFRTLVLMTQARSRKAVAKAFSRRPSTVSTHSSGTTAMTRGNNPDDLERHEDAPEEKEDDLPHIQLARPADADLVFQGRHQLEAHANNLAVARTSASSSPAPSVSATASSASPHPSSPSSGIHASTSSGLSFLPAWMTAARRRTSDSSVASPSPNSAVRNLPYHDPSASMRRRPSLPASMMSSSSNQQPLARSVNGNTMPVPPPSPIVSSDAAQGQSGGRPATTGAKSPALLPRRSSLMGIGPGSSGGGSSALRQVDPNLTLMTAHGELSPHHQIKILTGASEAIRRRGRRRSEFGAAGALTPIMTGQTPALSAAPVAHVLAPPPPREGVLFPRPLGDPLEGGTRSKRDLIYAAWRASGGSAAAVAQSAEVVMTELGVMRRRSTLFGSPRAGEMTPPQSILKTSAVQPVTPPDMSQAKRTLPSPAPSRAPLAKLAERPPTPPLSRMPRPTTPAPSQGLVTPVSGSLRPRTLSLPRPTTPPLLGIRPVAPAAEEPSAPAMMEDLAAVKETRTSSVGVQAAPAATPYDADVTTALLQPTPTKAVTHAILFPTRTNSLNCNPAVPSHSPALTPPPSSTVLPAATIEGVGVSGQRHGSFGSGTRRASVASAGSAGGAGRQTPESLGDESRNSGGSGPRRGSVGGESGGSKEDRWGDHIKALEEMMDALEEFRAAGESNWGMALEEEKENEYEEERADSDADTVMMELLEEEREHVGGEGGAVLRRD